MTIRIAHRIWRTAGWIAVFCGVFIGIIIAIGVLVTGGQWWAAPIAIICCSLAGGLVGFNYLNHMPKLEISSAGVRAKRFFHTQFYPWKDFIQAGVTWMRNRGMFFHEIVLLLPGGSKREKNDTWFYIRNFSKIVYLPYRDDVLLQVLQGYGKLDFCFLNGSETEDYYAIEVEKE